MPGARLDQLLPSLRARIVRIAGRPVAEVQVAPNVAWTVSRDRGFTYAATLPEGSELVEGSWWPADYQGRPRSRSTRRLPRATASGSAIR